MLTWKTISELDSEVEPFVLVIDWAGGCRLLQTDKAKQAMSAICWYYPIPKLPRRQQIILEDKTNERIRKDAGDRVDEVQRGGGGEASSGGGQEEVGQYHDHTPKGTVVTGDMEPPKRVRKSGER